MGWEKGILYIWYVKRIGIFVEVTIFHKSKTIYPTVVDVSLFFKNVFSNFPKIYEDITYETKHVNAHKSEWR